jgi:cytoskeletal protein RodZ
MLGVRQVDCSLLNGLPARGSQDCIDPDHNTPALPQTSQNRYKIGVMSSVAQQLHQAREARHLTVEQVADITKIRSDHVRAIEDGNFDVFSAPVYIRGFVRTYSTLLKLDVQQVMAELDAELGQNKKFAEPPPLSDSPRTLLDMVMLQLSKVDWRKAVAVLGIVVLCGLVLLGITIWRHYRTSDPLKKLKPGIYQPSSKNSGETLPLPSTPPKR